MRLNRKVIWLVLAFFAALTVIATLAWKKGARPQIVTLPNGEKYRFAGVTYSTSPIPPQFGARLISRLPAPLSKFGWQYFFGPRFGAINANVTLEPQLRVWFRRLDANTPAFGPVTTLYAMLADEGGVEAGRRVVAGFSTGVAWASVSFEVVPRRSRVVQCRLYASTIGGGQDAVSRVNFRNPLYARFPQWRPESLPAIKTTGDLEVRLAQVMVGTLEYGRMEVFHATMSGEEPRVVFDLVCHALGASNDVSVVHNADLSDATGNHLRVRPGSDSGRPRKHIPGALWPGEEAWRLKLELKRKSGYAPDELVTFTNVPVPMIGARNQAIMTNVVGGVQVALAEFLRAPNIVGNARGMPPAVTQIVVELPGKPEGVAVDFVKVKADTGEELESIGNGWRDFARLIFLKRIPTNAQTIDVTLVVQKTRSVEFQLAPPKAPKARSSILLAGED